MRFKKKYDKILTKEFLQREYAENNQSALDIANQIGCDQATVYNYLRLYQIDRKQIRQKVKPGETFNHLTAIKIVGKTKNGTKIWLCKCDCGNLHKVDGSSLALGKTKSCGCSRTRQPIFPNMVFGDLTVIRKEGSNKYNKVLWLCKCKCGKFSTPTASSLRNGSSKTCGCSHRRKAEHSGCWKGCGDISGGKWIQIITSANNRNINFNITIENGWSLFEKQEYRCALSGLHLDLDRKSCTASLDRIDSAKGYELDNVQWVHKDINNIKASITQDEFIHLCKLITSPLKQIKNIVPYNISIYKKFWNRFVDGAKRRNIKFDLSQLEALNKFRNQNGLCAFTNQIISIPQNNKEYKNSLQTASLDRIDNTDYYHIDNIQWAHKVINMSRKDLNIDYYKYLCKLVSKYNNLNKETK